MITFENCDCMEALRKFPDKFFDLAIVDPPYGIGVQSMNFTRSGSRPPRGKAAARRRDYRRTDEWDVKPGKEYFDELFRVSRNQIIWGGNYFTEFLPPSHGFICWDKRCQDNMRNDFSDAEYAWISRGLGVARMYRYLWNGMLQGDMKHKEQRFHPTQKPIDLYKWILFNYAKPGYKILDTHVGSGSSLIACYDMGFDVWGYEIDPDYYSKAKARLKEEQAQIRLF